MGAANLERQDPDYDEKLQELNRLCGTKSVHPELRQIIRWLGDKTLADPDFRASARDICVGVRRITPQEEMTSSDHSWFRTHMNRARGTRLAAFYKKPSSQEVPFRIFLPFVSEQDDSTKEAPYVLHFHDRREPADRSQVVAVWQRMVHAIDKIKDVILIYDTPTIPTKSPALKEPGTWSGSGEVAAACFIGQTMARLKPAVEMDVRRWRDIDDMDIVKRPWHCVIILGSSLKNDRLRNLRERPHLKDRQRYHFDDAGVSSGKHGYIWKDENTEKNRFVYSAPSESKAGKEYALVSFFPDPDHQQILIAMQGITTVGTLAAARFMTSPDGVEALRQIISRERPFPRELPSFEVVLEVCIYKNGKLGDIKIHEYEIFRESVTHRNSV